MLSSKYEAFNCGKQTSADNMYFSGISLLFRLIETQVYPKKNNTNG